MMNNFKLLKSCQNRLVGITLFTILAIISSGCSKLGSYSIKAGRGAYNEAINYTDAQQTLMTIVRHRYGEKSTILAVTSVTANVSVTSKVGFNIGIGSKENFEGNLVPLSGGVVYEENPTITYAPVQGREYIRKLLSPIPIELLALTISSELSPEEMGKLIIFLISRVNDIKNPAFLSSKNSLSDPRFLRYVDLTVLLVSSGNLFFISSQDIPNKYAFVITDYKSSVDEVQEFLNILGISKQIKMFEDIVLPINFAIHKSDSPGISLKTRSIWDLVQILGSTIQLPEDNELSENAIKYPPPGLPTMNLKILSSKQKPINAAVQINYNRNWYYIDRNDKQTKTAFRILQEFWGVMIADASKGSLMAPVLTVPVN